MRGEIRRICKEAGFTTIYVTHDQKEALSVADRIAVMRAGRLAQVGTPGELYHRPASSFVADFIGNTNLLPGRVAGREGQHLVVETAAGRLLAGLAQPTVGDSDATPAGASDGRVIVSIRPEQMQIARNGAVDPRRNRLVGRPIETTFLGEASEHVLEVNDQRVKVISAPPLFDVPPEMAVEFDPEDVVVLNE
jgi:iron(III) transport system ATP-binding protein